MKQKQQHRMLQTNTLIFSQIEFPGSKQTFCSNEKILLMAKQH